jgi:myosin heavy subunit|nr:MAG TPA: minor tail protein [Caudoviricetes sp.]
MASSDIIKIGFDYRSSLAQFEKDTNGVFDGISSKAGKQKITIQLDAKDDKVIDKIKELQKLKLDKFTFEFGNSGLKEQLQTFDKLENKINEIINLSKGIGNSSAPIVDVNKSSKEIDKLENKISELNKKYDELQKKSATGGISGKEVNLVDNDEFKKLSQEVSELKDQFDDLKTHMSLLDDYTVPTDRFFELQTQVEATSVKVSNLVDEMTRLSNVQKNIGVETNISSTSTESVTNSIKEENNVLEQNTQKVKENTQAKKQNANVNLNKYDKRLDSYNGKIDKYKTTIDRFNDGGWTSSTYLENVQAVKNAVKEYETLLNELKGKDASLVTSDDINRLDNYEKKIKDTIATVTNMSASEKGYNFVSGQKELDKIHKLLNENSKMSSEAKAKIKAYYAEIESGNPSMSLDKIHGEILKIYNAEVEAGRAGRTLFDTLKNSGFHQIAAQMAGMVGVYDVINVIKQAASTVTELNTQITELAKVSEQSSKQIYADFDSYADIAKEVRGTISDTIAATADWSKNGYSIPDAKQLAEISQLYKNVGDGIDIDTANESLISTLKGFQLEADQAEHIVDVFNEVDLLASYYSNVIALCIYMHIDSNYIG